MEILNFIKIYENSFAQNWDLPALTDYTKQETMTYGQLAQSIALAHVFYESVGIKPGDKIALCGKDSSDWIRTYMGIVTYGAIVVPILADFNPIDITHIVNHSGASILVVQASIWEHIDPESLVNVKAVFALNSSHVLYEADGQEIRRHARLSRRRFEKKYPNGYTARDVRYADRSNDEVTEINYTSGTTGFSKGVMLTGRNLAGNVCFGMQSKLHYRKSRALSFLPLAHAYACAFDMLTPLAVGSHVTVLDKTPSPRILLKALAEVKPNLIICVPLILEKIYKNQILPMLAKKPINFALSLPLVDGLVYSKIRKKLIEAFGGDFYEVIVGGAALNHEVEDFLYKIKFPFTVGYGMTECGPLISYTDWKEFKPGSAGRTLPIMETIVMSEDPEKIPGEVCVRGVNVMKGYYRNQAATDAVLDKDGWLKTGDMGTRTPDGTLFLRGRNKTMLLSASGQNIYPEEIEAKLNNMPFVAESLVVERDGKLVGLVYPDYPALDKLGLASTDLGNKVEEIRAELNKLVAPYERLSKIQLIPNEFEKTPKRSIKRFLYS
ncbi:MAG: AMP-binding protein [Muribaculum sp.]|nr:AMP-binding protein [Muribaculum sp.]